MRAFVMAVVHLKLYVLSYFGLNIWKSASRWSLTYAMICLKLPHLLPTI